MKNIILAASAALVLASSGIASAAPATVHHHQHIRVWGQKYRASDFRSAESALASDRHGHAWKRDF